MGGGVGRDLHLDALRGFAILLMVVDHAALFLFHLPVSHPLRVATRLAEPLFVAVFASLLFPRSTLSLHRRLSLILSSALITNMFFYPATGRLDVLASFSIAYALRILFPSLLPKLFWLILLYPLDPTRAFLDYPATLFLSQVAFFLPPTPRKAVFLTLFSSLTGVHSLTAITTPLAALLLKHRALFPPLSLLVWAGQRPLLIYTLHLPVLIVLGYALAGR